MFYICGSSFVFKLFIFAFSLNYAKQIFDIFVVRFVDQLLLQLRIYLYIPFALLSGVSLLHMNNLTSLRWACNYFGLNIPLKATFREGERNINGIQMLTV